MYTLMSNKQYYDALNTTGKIANTEGINSMYTYNTFTNKQFDVNWKFYIVSFFFLIQWMSQ